MVALYLKIIVFSSLALSLHGQSSTINISGFVFDLESKTRLSGVTVSVIKDTIVCQETTTNDLGYYTLTIEANSNYEVLFSSEAYFTKYFSLDITPDDIFVVNGSSKLNVDMYLPLKRNDKAPPLYLEPMGLAKMDYLTGLITWNLGYTLKMKALEREWISQRSMDSHQDLNPQLQHSDDFERFIAQGDSAFNKKDFVSAVEFYIEAFFLQPGNQEVLEKIYRAKERQHTD